MAMNIPTLKAAPRAAAGTRAAARLRRDGKLPAIVYGHEIDPEPVTLDYHDVEQQLHRHAHVVNLELNGKQQACLFKDLQYDHLGVKLLHVDLTRVDLTERVQVNVPLEFRGTARGVAAGGALQTELAELEIECLATMIPESIRVNVADLELDQVWHVKDLKLEEGITAVTDPETVVVAVRVPMVRAVPAAAEAEVAVTPTEPEVIAKGKVEEPEEES